MRLGGWADIATGSPVAERDLTTSPTGIPFTRRAQSGDYSQEQFLSQRKVQQ